MESKPKIPPKPRPQVPKRGVPASETVDCTRLSYESHYQADLHNNTSVLPPPLPAHFETNLHSDYGSQGHHKSISASASLPCNPAFGYSQPPYMEQPPPLQHHHSENHLQYNYGTDQHIQYESYDSYHHDQYTTFKPGSSSSLPGMPVHLGHQNPALAQKDSLSSIDKMKSDIHYPIFEQSFTHPHFLGKPSIYPNPNFNPDEDVMRIRKAITGSTTDKLTLIEIFGRRTTEERVQIRKYYRGTFGKFLGADLIRDKSVAGDFEHALVWLLKSRVRQAADTISYAANNKSISKTDQYMLVQILLALSPQDMLKLRKKYRFVYGLSLPKTIGKKFDGDYGDFLTALTCGLRDPDNDECNIALVRNDARLLQAAGIGRVGVDEGMFIYIFCRRSWVHLRAVFAEYQKTTGRDIESSIDSEFKQDSLCKMAFKCVIRMAQDPSKAIAKFLYDSLKGLGTRDKMLIHLLVFWADINLASVKIAFKEQHHSKGLDRMIQGETSGSYEKLLLSIVG